MAFQQGDYASAQKLLTAAVDVQRYVRDTLGLAMAVTHAGLAARGLGQYTAARAFHEEAVELSLAAGNRGYEAVNLGAIAHSAYLQGPHDVARKLATDDVAILNTLSRGRPLLLDERANIPLYVLGRVALCASDYTAARRHLQENLDQWRTTGDARSAPGALVGLGCVAVAEGQFADAQNLLLEALAVSEQLGSRVGLVQALEGFAILAAAVNQPERAVRLASEAASQRVALHNPISPAEHTLVERWLAPARRTLGEGASAVTSAGAAAFPGTEELGRSEETFARSGATDDELATHRARPQPSGARGTPPTDTFWDSDVSCVRCLGHEEGVAGGVAGEVGRIDMNRLRERGHCRKRQLAKSHARDGPTTFLVAPCAGARSGCNRSSSSSR